MKCGIQTKLLGTLLPVTGIAAASEELFGQAQMLKKPVGRFRLSEDADNGSASPAETAVLAMIDSVLS